MKSPAGTPKGLCRPTQQTKIRSLFGGAFIMSNWIEAATNFLQSGKNGAPEMNAEEVTSGMMVCGQSIIEVTPEMVKAGVDEFLSYDSRDLVDTPAREIVIGIFKAMRDAEQREATPEEIKAFYVELLKNVRAPGFKFEPK